MVAVIVVDGGVEVETTAETTARRAELQVGQIEERRLYAARLAQHNNDHDAALKDHVEAWHKAAKKGRARSPAQLANALFGVCKLSAASSLVLHHPVHLKL